MRPFNKIPWPLVSSSCFLFNSESTFEYIIFNTFFIFLVHWNCTTRSSFCTIHVFPEISSFLCLLHRPPDACTSHDFAPVSCIKNNVLYPQTPLPCPLIYGNWTVRERVYVDFPGWRWTESIVSRISHKNCGNLVKSSRHNSVSYSERSFWFVMVPVHCTAQYYSILCHLQWQFFPDFIYLQCRIKGGAMGAAAPGPAVFGGPQLVRVVSWL